MVQSPAAAETQVWTFTSPAEPASCSVPLRRSFTRPSFRGSTQVWQMPIRQPYGSATPALSAASRIVVAPSDSTVLPVVANVIVPPSADSLSCAPNRSRCRWSSRPRQCRSHASSIGAGPHAHV